MMRIIFLEESSYSFTVFRCLIFGGKVKSLHSFKTCKTSIKTFSRLSVTLIIFIVIYYIFKKFVARELCFESHIFDIDSLTSN